MSDLRASRQLGADSRTRLADRLLIVAGGDALAAAAHVDVPTGGLVVTGSDALATVRTLHAAYPELLLLAEPQVSSTHRATAEQPFGLPEGDGLWNPTLGDVLDAQREAGAALAVTPTGYIDTADSDAAKAVVEVANHLDRDDVLLLLPCHWTWAREPNVSQLVAIAGRSKHPVAIALADDGDPLAHTGVPNGIRRLASETPWMMPWRTDLAAFDAFAHGARAAAVGLLPSQRHAVKPGQRGRAIDPSNRTPNVLVPELLRYVRARYMHDEWFASARPWTCSCPICRGRAVDRFSGSDADRLQAHIHNLVGLGAMHLDMRSGGPSAALWWKDRLHDARIAHERLEAHTSTKAKMPPVLEAWLQG